MQKDGKLHVRSSKFASEAVSAWAVDVDGNAGADGTDGAADRDGGVDVDNDDDTNGSVGGMGGMVKPPVFTSAKKSYQLKKEGLWLTYFLTQSQESHRLMGQPCPLSSSSKAWRDLNDGQGHIVRLAMEPESGCCPTLTGTMTGVLPKPHLLDCCQPSKHRLDGW